MSSTGLTEYQRTEDPPHPVRPRVTRQEYLIRARAAPSGVYRLARAQQQPLPPHSRGRVQQLTLRRRRGASLVCR